MKNDKYISIAGSLLPIDKAEGLGKWNAIDARAKANTPWPNDIYMGQEKIDEWKKKARANNQTVPAEPLYREHVESADCWCKPEVEDYRERAVGYSHDRYNELVQETVEMIKKLSELKGGEYAGDVDRLANFRRNADNLGLQMLDVWAVYAGKHWDAINQYIKDQRNGKKRERLESIAGRADDLIVYAILFKAIVEEQNGQD